MGRKAAKLLGLVLVGAAVFSCLRSWRRRHDGDDEPVEAAPAPASTTHLTPVPDVPAPAPAPDPGPGWVPPVAEACPPGYPIKVNERSGIYHVPGGLSYDRTSPTRCYRDEAAAEDDGFRRAKR